MPIALTFRAFAGVTRDAEANEIMDAIHRHLSVYEVLSSKVEKYWKIPELYELFITLRARDADLEPIIEIKRLSAALGTVWTLNLVFEDDAGALWRKEDGGQFVDPRVTWANMQCFVVEK